MRKLARAAMCPSTVLLVRNFTKCIVWPVAFQRHCSGLTDFVGCFAVPVAFARGFASKPRVRSTTILSVRKGNEVVVVGDGQMSRGPTIVKATAKKVRRIGSGKVIVGFAGSTADCLTLMDRLDKKLEEYPDQLLRASVEMAKLWRTDKFLRHLEAWMIAVDKDTSLTLTGNGDVIAEPSDGVIGIGSGGHYAAAAARALIDVPGMTAMDIAQKAMKIAAEICVYTNDNFVIERMDTGKPAGSDGAQTSATAAGSTSSADETKAT